MPEPMHRCWAEIDLAALERNLGRIRAALPRPIRYVAIIKADAYGHGLHPVAARLMQSGADMFGVANVHEAASLREIGSGWQILVLSAVLAEERPMLLEHKLIATVSSQEEVDALNELAKSAGTQLPVHMKIDTGMGRLGVWHTQAHELYQRIRTCKHLKLEGIYTHFSCADSDPEFTRTQRQLFLDTLARLPDLETQPLMIHADNSAALESLESDSPFNAVRVGLLQFGVLPYPDSVLSSVKPEPVLSFYTRIGAVKTLPAGTGVSYGRTRILERDTKVAITTAGYGDGIPTQLSNRGKVLIRGKRCEILGRVTMDQVIVEIEQVPEAQPGDPVTLIGKNGNEAISVSEFARWANSIPWEVFCSITKRVPRIYRADRGV